jgi:hypothetical protein
MAVVVLGLWVIVLPHLGVPHSWSVVITTLTGAIVIATGLYMRAKALGGGARRSTHHPFIENASLDGVHEHAQNN